MIELFELLNKTTVPPKYTVSYVSQGGKTSHWSNGTNMSNKTTYIIHEPKKSDKPGVLAGILETFKVSLSFRKSHASPSF